MSEILSSLDNPREKLKIKGVEALSDRELVAVIIGQGSKEAHVDEASRLVIEEIDKKDGKPELNALRFLPGMGEVKAGQILAALEFGRRRKEKRQSVIRCPEDIFENVKHYSDREQECLVVISLNGAKEIISEHVISIGTMDKTLIHPREVFSTAIKERAAAIVMAHNHPSGNTSPSPDDIKATLRISECGKMLGIKLMDHIVFSKEQYYSFLQHKEENGVVF